MPTRRAATPAEALAAKALVGSFKVPFALEALLQVALIFGGPRGLAPWNASAPLIERSRRCASPSMRPSRLYPHRFWEGDQALESRRTFSNEYLR